jgi:cyanate permease
MSLDVIFAYVVGALAGLAVIGALAFALVWEWCAIRRTLAAHRRTVPDASFWRDRAALTIPQRRP